LQTIATVACLIHVDATTVFVNAVLNRDRVSCLS